MRAFLEIQAFEKIILYAFINIGVFAAIILFMNHRQEKRYLPYMFFDSVCLFISYMEFNMLVAVMSFLDDDMVIGSWRMILAHKPVLLFVAIQVFVVGVEALLLVNDYKWRANHLSYDSIRESMDSMPYGICYYYESGMPRLINQEMQNISKSLFGEMISNASTFWERICTEASTSQAERIMDYPSPTWVSQDGKVLSFVRKKIPYEKSFLYEILATDITEEYEKHKKLSVDNEHMSNITERLREYSKKVTALTIEKEILDTKVRVHSELGQTLVATRRYFVAQDIDKQELLGMWNKNIMLLKKEGNSVSQYDYEILNINAKKLGVVLTLPDKLPSDEEVKEIILAVCNECVTNAYKYASCKALELEVMEEETKVILHIWNEGDIPDEEIKEKGGLRNLRRMIETKGGKMQITNKPYFGLTVTMEKG